MKLKKSKWLNLEKRLNGINDIVLLDKDIEYTFGTEAGPNCVLNHWMTFVVAPKTSKYTIKGMENVRLKLKEKLGFEKDKGYYPVSFGCNPDGFKIVKGEYGTPTLSLGRLFHYEIISKVQHFHKVETTSLDKDLSKQEGFQSNKKITEYKEETHKGRRMINIAVLPSISIYDYLLKKVRGRDDLFNFTFEPWVLDLYDLVKKLPEFKRLYPFDTD